MPIITQQHCNEKAQSLTGQGVSPTLVQGGNCYTVVSRDIVVQFREPKAAMGIAFFQHVELAYDDFTPYH
jgi:hypothetical protein